MSDLACVNCTKRHPTAAGLECRARPPVADPVTCRGVYPKVNAADYCHSDFEPATAAAKPARRTKPEGEGAP